MVQKLVGHIVIQSIEPKLLLEKHHLPNSARRMTKKVLATKGIRGKLAQRTHHWFRFNHLLLRVFR